MPAFLAPLIAAIVAGFSRLVATRAGMWVVSVLGFLGLSIATQEVAMGPIMGQVASHMAGVGGDLARWMGVLQLDRYVSVCLSAYTVGTVKRAFLARRAG